jgi:ComF family protein
MEDLPRTRFHADPANKVAQLFWGRVPVEHATAWLFFRKGSRYQRLVHYLKYKGLKEIGDEMGRLFGSELKGSPFEEVEVVVPLPLHRKRERQRGYNQSEWIARGIADSLGIPLSVGNLVRSRITSTQTRKNRFERWQNVEGIFTVLRPQEYTGRHVLVVDDVVTTGATLEAAVVALRDAGSSRVSLATLACAEVG